jgi:ABC-2 type transport system ATP-binding protein
VSDLSRGTQQKVAIVCALIHNPPILLLDEPTLGLDVKASRTIKNWITDLAQKQKKTVVLTTHQLDIAEQLCERIVIMNKGKIIADQPTQELLTTVHEEHYQIAVAGKVKDSGLILPGMDAVEKDDHTLYIGAILDQDELYKKLALIHDLKLPLLSVTRTKNNLEEVFMHLTHKGEVRDK